MACVNMIDILSDAKRERYAIAAFNILDYNSMRAVVEAAEELNAPVIVQVSVKTIKLWGYRAISGWYKQLANESPVPVVLHLDHCKEIEIIKKCMDNGWTSVMIDASSLPFNDNLTLTKEVVRLAKPRGISVEAELGEIGGVEDDIVVNEADAHLADIDKSILFCWEAKPDLFAPAIGTAHGVYKGEPKIAFDRLEQISKHVDIPIALHGGTGLSDDVFKRCISLGCAKINISTQLKRQFITSFIEHNTHNPYDFEPMNYISYQLKIMKNDIAGYIQLFGGQNKANF
jgi:ketose-bisphosphate aldolase